MRFSHLAVLGSLAIASALGCKKAAEPEASAEPPVVSSVSNAPAAQPAAKPTDKIEITWTDPPGWERVKPSSPMRKASFRVPKVASDPEDAELAVFYFGPGQGGNIEANVDRWVKQFSDIKPDAVKRADRSANGLRQHTVEIAKGTFASGMPGGPTNAKRGYGMLAAIVEAPSGNYFFKLTGPTNTVQGAREAFYGLLDSVKPAS